MSSNYALDYSYEKTGALAAIGGIYFFYLAVTVITVVSLWKIFTKAGEPGWAAIVPFYNLYVLFKITWGSGWKFLLMLIPIVGFVFLFIALFKLAAAFGRSAGFGVGLIFLSYIFLPILAFSNSEYSPY